MKNKLIIIFGTTILAVASASDARAVAITGNIGFSGSAQLNSGSVQTATEVLSWMNTVVSADSGSFATVVPGTSVVLAPSWMLNSGPINDFWKVDGFTFNLISSSLYSQDAAFVNVLLSGTVTGNGYSPTDFTGSFQVGNPSANGLTTFTERFSFSNAAPDRASTLALLGLTCLGMAVVKRKYFPALVVSKITSHETRS